MNKQSQQVPVPVSQTFGGTTYQESLSLVNLSSGKLGTMSGPSGGGNLTNLLASSL